MASKVTLMPINDLGVDAAILFSDILIIPESMGMNLEFTDNGPKFYNPIDQNRSNSFLFDPSKLDHVYSNIKQIKNDNSSIPLIGFCGGPLTTFLFMFRGNEKDKSFNNALKFFYSNKKESLKILEQITEASVEYVKGQIDSGIDCFQLFETYCGIIPSSLYKELILGKKKSSFGKFILLTNFQKYVDQFAKINNVNIDGLNKNDAPAPPRLGF